LIEKSTNINPIDIEDNFF